jgi:hypothetical protein
MLFQEILHAQILLALVDSSITVFIQANFIGCHRLIMLVFLIGPVAILILATLSLDMDGE